ncbi:MAG: hypothetical protein JO104_07000 [Candidatus Eremiobacteraeota bacterium]|nr:hypothetical protein [Candidatus Eremiobacteraeota bacterium]
MPTLLIVKSRDGGFSAWASALIHAFTLDDADEEPYCRYAAKARSQVLQGEADIACTQAFLVM